MMDITKPCHQQPLLPSASVMFVSKAGITSGAVKSYGLGKRIEAVKNTRNVGKHDMKFNGATPKMEVDPESYVSRAIPHTENTLRMVDR